MLTIFKYSLSKARGQILGWGIGLGLFGIYLVQFYDTLAGMKDQIMLLLSSYPPELMAFFGEATDMFSPAGYLNVEFFSYMPIIIGIYSVLVGSGLLVSDEENGTLDLLLAYPISRASFFYGRFIAFVVATVSILVLIWLGFILAIPSTDLNIGFGQMALPFLALFALLMVFGMLALLLSQLVPSRRMAAMASGLILVASYFISSLARIDPDLRSIARYSPLNYYQGGEAIEGINWEWFLGLLGAGMVFTLISWWRFEHREIRVGGEGGWQFLSALRLHKKKRLAD